MVSAFAVHVRLCTEVALSGSVLGVFAFGAWAARRKPVCNAIRE